MSAVVKDHAHRESMIEHSIRKLWERRGIALSAPEYEAIAAGIRAGLYKQVAIDHHGQKVFEVSYRDRTVYAVWAHEFDCVRTFLPCREWVGSRKVAKNTFANMLARARI